VVLGETNHSTVGSDELPLVSIVVPSYNHEKYIVECLESIHNLDYPRLELLISDDCSRDQTFTIAEHWIGNHRSRFERVQIVRQESNLGIAGNLQFLFDDACGQYVAPIASDDLFVASAITHRVRILQKNRKIDAIFGTAQFISESGVLIRKNYIPKLKVKMLLKLSTRKLLAGFMLLEFPASGPLMILRKDAVRENGSIGRLRRDLKIEDVYMYVRLAALGKLAFINTTVAKYRQTPGSLGEQLTRSDDFVTPLLISYRMIQPLLKGFNRVALDHNIARLTFRLEQGSTGSHRRGALRLRITTLMLRVWVYLLCVPLNQIRIEA
jgi:alpha-1,3-rhamnosyltransferase